MFDSTDTSSARIPCAFGPLADLAISVFRVVSIHSVFPNPHVSLLSALKKLHEKNWRVTLRVQGLYHPPNSLWMNSCRHSSMAEYGSPYLFRILIFWVFGILVGSCNHSSDVSEVNGSPRACLSTLSLDSIAGWWCERSISWPEGVVDVEVDELERLVVEPGTTPGTKFSVLHCIRKPFPMRCGFWPLIHSYEYPCSSKRFPKDRTAGVSSRTFFVKNICNSLTNCGLFMRLHLKFLIQRNSSPFCWSCTSTLRSPQQFLFPQVWGLMAQESTKFPKAGRLFNVSHWILGYVWRTSALLHGHIALAIPSLPETDPQILEDWGYSDEDHLGKSFQAMDSWSRMLAWRTTAFKNRTHRIGFSIFELFRKIDQEFGGSMSWSTQPNCRAISNKATALLSSYSFSTF